MGKNPARRQPGESKCGFARIILCTCYTCPLAAGEVADVQNRPFTAGGTTKGDSMTFAEAVLYAGLALVYLLKALETLH
jgi:hypothetical protein